MFNTFLQPNIVFFSQHMPIPSQPEGNATKFIN